MNNNTVTDLFSSWHKSLWIDNDKSYCLLLSLVLVHRWTQMELFHFDSHLLNSYLKDFHWITLFHWLLHSGMMWTLEEVETFSLGWQIMPTFSKEPVINCRGCFPPLPTSLQPHCLLPHGTEWQGMVRDLRYLHILLLVTITTHCSNTAWRSRGTDIMGQHTRSAMENCFINVDVYM